MDYLQMAVHEEFAKRMQDEHHRMNHRIGDLEQEVREIGKIAASVEKLAVNMSNMLEEQQEQGDLLKKQGEQIASMQKTPPVDTWTRIKGKALDSIVTVVMNAAAVGALLLIAEYVR